MVFGALVLQPAVNLRLADPLGEVQRQHTLGINSLQSGKYVLQSTPRKELRRSRIG